MYSGWFDAEHHKELINALLPKKRSRVPFGEHPRIGEANVYFTMQAVNRDLLARRANRIALARSGQSTGDEDIIAYTLFAVDIDPRRIAGISATAEEKRAARHVKERVKAWFVERGIQCIEADSGNGYHLLVPTVRYDDISGAAEKAKVLLTRLAARFDTPEVSVDTTVFNPSRILKLYGTKAVKGDHTENRPHRWAGIDLSQVPADIDLFGVLADEIETSQAKADRPHSSDPGGTSGQSGWDRARSVRELEQVLQAEGLTYRRQSKGGRELFIFEQCPIHTDHDGHTFECCVLVEADGRYGGSCKHDANVHWKDFKTAIGWDKHRREGKSGANGQADSSDGVSEDKEKKPSQATVLVELADEAEFFHDSRGDAFVTVPVADHWETHSIRSRPFRRWLVGLFWRRHKKAPQEQAVRNALATLESKALFDGPEGSVAVRLAECDDTIWLDLADERWRAVKVTKDGWGVVDNAPVRFLRPRGMRALPSPVAGGRVSMFRDLLNLGGEDDWVLLVSWILAALRPKGPYPVLAVSGEQGSAKSTLCRLVRAVVDPNVAPLRTVPREVRDLMIAASHSWVLGYDNLSNVPLWLSDALCRLATGGGFSTRELYTDEDEIIFDAMRPVLINGIEDVATRSDLLDRAICLYLPTIPDGERRTEQRVFADFERQRPQILGAFLDAVSQALRKLPTIQLTNPPRMADFSLWAVAGEEGLGLQRGAFLRAYRSNRADANGLALEACVLAATIQEFIAGRDLWEGTAQELLDELESGVASDKLKNRRDWPKSPQAVGKRIRRIAPNLRRAGIEVNFEKGSGKMRKRIIRLFRAGNQPSDLSESAPSELIADMSDMSDHRIPKDTPDPDGRDP